MLGTPFHRPSQLRGHYRKALTQYQRRDCHIAQLELHAHKKAIRAHVIKLRRFKNVRALFNQKAGHTITMPGRSGQRENDAASLGGYWCVLPR